METVQHIIAIDELEQRITRMAKQMENRSPHASDSSGRYGDMPVSWWTSGFYPGLLWLMHDVTGNAFFKNQAEGWSRKIEEAFQEHPIILHHDVGFQFLLTAVMEYEQTGSEDGLRIGLKAANYLAGRFNPIGGFIKAWNGDDKKGWAIIDCMMNISLLYWASRVTNDPSYGQIASAHANTTLQWGVRDDGSTSHILSFNSHTGEFIESIGGQGYGPESAWSRGTPGRCMALPTPVATQGSAPICMQLNELPTFFLQHCQKTMCRTGIFAVAGKKRSHVTVPPRPSPLLAYLKSKHKCHSEKNECTGGRQKRYCNR